MREGRSWRKPSWWQRAIAIAVGLFVIAFGLKVREQDIPAAYARSSDGTFAFECVDDPR